MSNGLAIFEDVELEILTNEDVNIEFNGECLFNGKQVCRVLEYINDRDAISTHVRENQKVKLKNSDVAIDDFRKLNNAGETFITEKGVMKLIIGSNMPKADEFEDKVWEIVTEVQSTGRYDSVEQQLKLIEDEQERKLSLNVYNLERVVKSNPSDLLTTLAYNNAKSELDKYLTTKEIEGLKSEVKELKEDFTKTSEQIKKDNSIKRGRYVF